MDPDDAFGALDMWLDLEMEKKVGGHCVKFDPTRGWQGPHLAT